MKKMVAVLFEENSHCAVFDIGELVKENIEFAQGNSWRGDVYETALHPLLDEYSLQHNGYKAFE